ncbi:MAG: trypsin-like peptidase domain-containing protein [Desulforhopalus sp.]
MQCPKCQNEQVNTLECEVCGLIFAKYRKAEARKKAEVDARAEKRAKRAGGLKLVQALILIVVVAGSTYYFTGYQNKPADTVKQVQSPATDIAIVEQKSSAGAEVDVVSASKQPLPVQHNVVERATKSTVSIETPWGTGSGFFINENYIVTNRHVIEFDEKKLAEFKHQVETARRMIELEREKINEMKKQLRQLPKGPSRSQLALIISAREEELRKVLPKYQEGEERLERLEEDLQPSDIKIVLADGTKHVANYLLVSETQDLALMSLFAGESTYIERPPESMELHQGDKVYTIGSPVGLRQTVTAGVFSGYRRHKNDGPRYLQTDAPINPGNSGGPLIDEHGYVRGVNTMILRNTEGIGFAIPIEMVFEEFSSALY